MRTLTLALSLALSSTALAQDAAIFSVANGSLSYKLIHKFHEVVGTSRKVEGKARLLSNGTTQIMVRVPVESFSSENSNRDAHMLEVVEAQKFPTVELKALANAVQIPAKFPGTVKAKVKGVVTFHGVQKPEDVDVAVTFADASHAEAVASFTISLEAYGVERPSLMFVKADDAVKIDTKLSLLRAAK